MVRSEKSMYMSDRQGYPDKFAEHFAEIQGLNHGYAPYPPGHKLREFQKAVQMNAKRGVSYATLNWVERGPGNVGGRSRAIVADPTDPDFNTWYIASVGGGVWKAQRSLQFGLEEIEWTPLTDHLPSLAATTLDLSQNNPNVMYFGTGEGFGNFDGASGVGIFKSIDKGENWTHLPATAVSTDEDWRNINRLAVHPDNPNIVVVVTNGAIFRTEDGGVSFKKVYDTAGRVQDLKVNKKDFNVQFASLRGTAILKSTDGGNTWKNSFTDFVYGAARIELAISESHPEVIWASVEGNGRELTDLLGRTVSIADIYRSVDNGNTWSLMEFADGTDEAAITFLADQGWYDNAITVHPFSPDTVYVGGVYLWKAWVNEGEEFSVETVTHFHDDAPFLGLFRFGGEFAGGALLVGYIDPDDEFQDITAAEMSSAEIRFGPGLTQMAHRFTTPPNGGTNSDGGAGISYPEYAYANYVEVPFQVWDTDKNRQLMVSFRDQANDGEWSLIEGNTNGPGATHSREYIFISKYDYNASAPKPEFQENGGFTKGLMYFIWPYGDAESGVQWDPSAPPNGILSIGFGIVEGQYRTTEEWGDNDVHVDHHGLTTLPTGQGNEFHILNVNDGGAAYSRDGGKRWSEADQSRGFNTSQFYDATKQPGQGRFIGGTQDNGTWASQYNPNNRSGWTHVSPGDGFDVVWKSADSLISSTQFNLIWRTVRGGPYSDNWELAGNIRDYGGQFVTSIGWTPKTGDVVFSISPTSGLLRSLDFGNSWHAIEPPDYQAWRTGGNNGKVRVSLADPSVVWAGYALTERASGRQITLHVSENALSPTRDVKIRAVPPPPFAPRASLSGLATHPFTRSTAYVTFSVACRPKVLRTEDMGNTWEDLSGFVGTDNCESTNGFPDAQVYDIEVFPKTPRIIWAGTDLGIFESRDHGETWAYLDNGLPAVSVWRIRIVDDQVVLATHGRGIWTLNINEVQTDQENTANEISDSFELQSNYPNPFNPSTTISFKVATPSHVRLTVFDMIGRKVATLTDQVHTGGTHKVQWDASAMGSGQYIYRMEADGELIGAKTMVLVK